MRELSFYQRVVFGFISLSAIVSVLFFGVARVPQPVEAKKVISFQTVAQTQITDQQIRTLARFLSCDRDDIATSNVFNLCNDGVIGRDLLSTNIALFLAEAYLDFLIPDLQKSLAKVQTFRPYQHPIIEDLNVSLFVQRVLPDAFTHLERLKKASDVNVEVFSSLVGLYGQQRMVSPEILRRGFLIRMQQQGDRAFDPRLMQADLSFCGLRSISDWLGLRFINLSAEFILNGAALAKEKGFFVSTEEAKADLIHQFAQGVQQFPKERQISLDQQMHSLGLSLSEAVECWQTILLFRSFIYGLAKNTLSDRLTCQIFDQYALQEVKVHSYEWPQYLRVSTAFDLALLQIYISSISPLSKESLEFPSTIYSLEDVEKKAPQLVQDLYVVRQGCMPLEKIGLTASFKEIISWQLKEENWELLAKNVPSLKKIEGVEERKAALNGLSSQDRKVIDAIARKSLVKEHPEWVQQVKSEVELEETTVALHRLDCHFPDCKHPHLLQDLLQKAFEGDLEAVRSLSVYSEGDSYVYFIEPIVKKGRKILTFEEALNLGILQDMAKKRLCLKDPSLEKTFDQDRELLAKAYCKNVLDQLQSDPKKRLLLPTKQALKRKKEGLEDPSQGLLAQFIPLQTEKVLTRGSSYHQNPFLLTSGEWSGIEEKEGTYLFFQCGDKQEIQEPNIQRMGYAQELLTRDAARFIARQMIEKMKQKHLGCQLLATDR